MEKIDCFIPYISEAQVRPTLDSLEGTGCVNKIYLLTTQVDSKPIPGYEQLSVDTLTSIDTLRTILEHTETSHLLYYMQYTTIAFVQYGLERMLSVAQSVGRGMIYSDHYKVCDGICKEHPVLDYQRGSLRDDFDFGPLVLMDWYYLDRFFKRDRISYKYAGWYNYRMYLSLLVPSIYHINEYLYIETTQDSRKSGEKMFDYVDPKNRDVQMEMEDVCTRYLKRSGALLTRLPLTAKFKSRGFTYEVSVIIPVRNRVRTIEDAIRSVFIQQASFKFNLIIVDNHSTDGTTEIIHKYAADDRLIHLIPEQQDLGIGGCWNEGVMHPMCGKFCIQLDSDDVYSGPDTLQKIVDMFYAEKCAMVIGTYQMTDFAMNEIAPGIIDHKEWTTANGRNNALRINGLGAPRAFYTPILRELKMPNVSYGEDYAIGLAISRTYRIGRIYDVLYLCRRWEENSDAALDVRKMNEHNRYKDNLRTLEFVARIRLNRLKSRSKRY